MCVYFAANFNCFDPFNLSKCNDTTNTLYTYDIYICILRAQPTQIFECFEGKRVLTVSCGAYHTACTAEIRPPGSLVRNCMGCLRRFPRIMPV